MIFKLYRVFQIAPTDKVSVSIHILVLTFCEFGGRSERERQRDRESIVKRHLCGGAALITLYIISAVYDEIYYYYDRM